MREICELENFQYFREEKKLLKHLPTHETKKYYFTKSADTRSTEGYQGMEFFNEINFFDEKNILYFYIKNQLIELFFLV